MILQEMRDGGPELRPDAAQISLHSDSQSFEHSVGKVAQFHPQVISYNSAISACERGWQWIAALHLFTHMRKVWSVGRSDEFCRVLLLNFRSHLWAERELNCRADNTARSH